MVKHLKKKTDGFTLIELMIVIGLIAILSMTAVPIISEVMPNHRLKGAAKDIYSNMQRAKLEAIKNNCDVIISFNAVAYTPAGGVGSYTGFVDNGAGGGTAGNAVRDGSETILFSVTMPKDVSLYDSTFAATTGYNRQGLTYNSQVGARVRLRTTNRWYEITRSTAGYVTLSISSDGVNFSL